MHFYQIVQHAPLLLIFVIWLNFTSYTSIGFTWQNSWWFGWNLGMRDEEQRWQAARWRMKVLLQGFFRDEWRRQKHWWGCLSHEEGYGRMFHNHSSKSLKCMCLVKLFSSSPTYILIQLPWKFCFSLISALRSTSLEISGSLLSILHIISNIVKLRKCKYYEER